MLFLLLIPIFKKPICFFKKLKLKLFGKVHIGKKVFVQNIYITVQNQTNVNNNMALSDFKEITPNLLEPSKEILKLPKVRDEPRAEDK